MCLGVTKKFCPGKEIVQKASLLHDRDHSLRRYLGQCRQGNPTFQTCLVPLLTAAPCCHRWRLAGGGQA